MDIERIFALAEQVQAGSDVDWEQQANSCKDEQESEIIRSMGVLAQIAELHSGDPMESSSNSAISGVASMVVTDDEVPASRRWGHLEKLQPIGRGGFGVVCKAWDPKLETWVALKLARRSSRNSLQQQRMLEEARLMARVRHENVVRIHGADEHDGRTGIWMEYVEGRSLAQIVQFEGKMDERRVLAIGRVLARALAAVHAADVIHKDVKAHNVMVESGGRLVLMDFGSSERLGDLNGEATYRSMNGTPHYFAPELFQDFAPSNQSDIYSLGVLLFFLLTAEYPIEARTLRDLARAHKSGRARSIADLRPGLDGNLCRVIDRALQPEPAQRYESVGRMAQDLVLHRTGTILRGALAGLAAAVVVAVGWGVWDHMTSFSVEASLFREGPPRMELHPGSHVNVGDRLYLELEGNKPLYVYVFTQDETGDSSVLFPIPGLELQNPVPANQVNRLPGTRQTMPVSWEVTSAGRTERLCMVGSLEPVEEIESVLRELPKPRFGQPLRYPTIDQETLSKTVLRGIQGLQPSEEKSSTPRQLEIFEQINHLTDKREKQRNIWVRRIELMNP